VGAGVSAARRRCRNPGSPAALTVSKKPQRPHRSKPSSLQKSQGDSAGPALAEQADNGWTLDYLTAAYLPRIVDGSFAVDLRAWSVRGLPGDGVQWQVRPLAVAVPGALTGDAASQSVNSK
jgi:hypothetical protein